MKNTKIINTLKSFKGVHSIFLFGSQAEGKSNKNSDFDYCIIEDPEKEISFRQKLRIMSYSNSPIDISFFHDLPIDIRMRIFKGNLIHTQNYDYVLQLIKVTDDDYSKYKYFKQEYNQKILEKRKHNGHSKN